MWPGAQPKGAKMADKSYLAGIPPRLQEIVVGFSELLADNVLVVIDRANITVAKNDTWHYSFPFRLVGETSGLVLPYTGTVGAAATLSTGSGPTPVVDDSTPAVVNGSGTVEMSHGDTGYDTGDVATLTITYTNLRGGTDTDTATVTFS
jgi:hypothetical protein